MSPEAMEKSNFSYPVSSQEREASHAATFASMCKQFCCRRSFNGTTMDEAVAGVLMAHILTRFDWPKGRPTPGPIIEGAFSLRMVLQMMV